MQIQDFNARNFQPQQGFAGHTPGRWPATISNTYVKPTKDNNGAMLCVEFTSQGGMITNYYNLFNNSAKAVEIAQKELSALCHATGVYDLRWPKDAQGNLQLDQCGRELRNAQCIIDVGPQTDKQGNPTEYMEIKKIYDKNGNEPGKSGSGAAPQVQQQPQQPGNAQWGGPQPSNPPNTPSQTWGAPQGQPPANPPTQPQQPQGWGPSQGQPPQAQGQPGGWQPGPPAGGPAPWQK